MRFQAGIVYRRFGIVNANIGKHGSQSGDSPSRRGFEQYRDRLSKNTCDGYARAK